MGFGLLWALSLPGLVVALVVLAALERFGLWTMRRKGTPASATGMEELDAFFSGAKRLELDERKSHSLMRDDEDSGAPPNDRVDFENGVIRISAPPRG